MHLEMWTTALIVTLDHLKFWNLVLPNICYFCCKDEISVDHLFYIYNFVSELAQQARASKKLDFKMQAH